MPATKKTAKKGMRRMKRVFRPKRSLAYSEFASASQTIRTADDNMNTVFKLDDIRLASFDRLVNISKAYQYYRITGVEVTFMPYADTYQTSLLNTAGAPQITSSVPYMYWLINKGDNVELDSFDALRDAGAKPLRFDDKNIKVRWTPFVRQSASIDPSAPVLNNFVLTRKSPWLSTNNNAGLGTAAWAPSLVSHGGLLYGVQQTYIARVDPEYQNVYGVTITVHVQFKKPLNQPGGPRQVPAVTKEIIPVEEEVPAEKSSEVLPVST